MRRRQTTHTTHHRFDRRPLIGRDLERCMFCHGTHIARAGKRYKQHEILQRWYCHTCKVGFAPHTAGKGSTYPIKVILEALCHFYQGYSIDRTVQHIRRRFGVSAHPRTLSRWLAEYRELTTYARLREHIRDRFPPHRLIRTARFHHKQVYLYRVHQGKLAHILAGREHQSYQPPSETLHQFCQLQHFLVIPRAG